MLVIYDSLEPKIQDIQMVTNFGPELPLLFKLHKISCQISWLKYFKFNFD